MVVCTVGQTDEDIAETVVAQDEEMNCFDNIENSQLKQNFQNLHNYKKEEI